VATRLTAEVVEGILRLLRAERTADTQLRRELAPVRRVLEDLVGPTVKPADAARLFGVSQPAVHRWLEKGEISTVLTPSGRREIPLGELIRLLDEVEQARAEGSHRPLARVLRERRSRSDEAIDIDRLLPPRRGRGHRAAELNALAYHRLIAERLDERLVDEARDRLGRWRRDGRIDPRWADEWERVLALPVHRIASTIAADTTHARDLRQSSPFAGMLNAQERKRLHSAVEQRVRA
jgi:hypothetical protein